MNPLITCLACNGTGKKPLSKRLSWCLQKLAQYQPSTPAELHAKFGRRLHISYFNHMLRRLERAGLVEENNGMFKVKQ